MTVATESSQWYQSGYCQTPNATGCLLWGVPWQFLVIAATIYVLAILAPVIVQFLFILIIWILRRYDVESWKEKIRKHLFYWTWMLLRWGLFWAAYVALQLPPNWTNVLRYIVPIPFVICLFFWANALGDAIADIGREMYETQRAGSTKAVGFIEIVRIGKYVAFIIVVFVAVLIFGGDVVGFLVDARLLGLIVVFALQPWLKNLVGGMTIFYDEKFVLGDEIRFGGVRGVVTDITLRSTKVLRSDNSIAIIPNGRLLEQPVANISQRDWNVVILRFALDYRTPVDTIRRLLTATELVLETHHPDLKKKSQDEMDSKKDPISLIGASEMMSPLVADSTPAENDRPYSVSLEGEYEMVVKAFIRRTQPCESSSPERVEEENLGDRKLVADLMLKIVEEMEALNVKRRSRSRARDGVPKAERSLFDPTNDDDIEYTTTLLAFYI